MGIYLTHSFKGVDYVWVKLTDIKFMSLSLHCGSDSEWKAERLILWFPSIWHLWKGNFKFIRDRLFSVLLSHFSQTHWHPLWFSEITISVLTWWKESCFSLSQNCCWPVTGDPQGQALCQHAYCDAESSKSRGIIMDMRIFIMQWGMIKQRDHSGRPKSLQGTLTSPWCWSEIMNWTQQRSTFTTLIWRLCPFVLDIMKATGKLQDLVFLGQLLMDVSTHDDASHWFISSFLNRRTDEYSPQRKVSEHISSLFTQHESNVGFLRYSLRHPSTLV